MSCKITATAQLQGNLQASVGLSPSLLATVSAGAPIQATAAIQSNSKQAFAQLAASIFAEAKIINGGIHSDVCPIILCIDGGNASTTVYPPINGLLNGGSA